MRTIGIPGRLVGLLLAPAVAGAVPTLDARDEHVIVGPGVTPPPARATGTWSAEPGRLALAAPADRRDAYWFPERAEATFADGFVRVRVESTRPFDLSIMLRAGLEADAARPRSGYGLSVERGRLVFYRWEDGIPDPVRPGRAVKGLARRRSLELCLWLVGPHVAVHVYDGETLGLLATETFTDATWPSGRVGLRLHAPKGSPDRLTLLSVRPAGSGRQGRVSPRGRHRVARLAAPALSALPAGLRRQVDVLEEEPLPAEGELWVRTPWRVHEQLVRRGVPVGPPVGEVAWQHLDPALRSRRESPDLDASLKDAGMVEALLRAWHERFPERTELVELGRTHGGRPVLALRLTDGPTPVAERPAVLLSGGMHGKELLAIDYVLDAIRVLLEAPRSDRRVRRWLTGLAVWCVPLVSPDANLAFVDRSTRAGRKNGRDTDGDGALEPHDGVDLNRNFPFRFGALGGKGSSGTPAGDWYRGALPGSEPETQAFMRLADREHFVASISFHTKATLLLTPYSTDGVDNPEPDEAKAVSRALAQAAPVQPNGRRLRVRKKMYTVTGVDQDWLRAAHGTVALLVEGADHNPTDPERRRANLEAMRPVWQGLLDRVADGPAVRGRVLDPEGRPVVATVGLEGVRLRAGEAWTSRCRDGRFHRLLTSRRRERVRAEAGAAVVAEARPGRETTVTVTPQAPLAQRVCPRPELCAVDTLCEAREGRCPRVGPAAWCLIDGVCRAAGSPAPDGRARCEPRADPFGWTG